MCYKNNNFFPKTSFFRKFSDKKNAVCLEVSSSLPGYNKKTVSHIKFVFIKD